MASVLGTRDAARQAPVGHFMVQAARGAGVTQDGPSRPVDPASFTPARWHDIEPIYALALALPPGERRDYLDGATFGDTELRAEIELLLQAAERKERGAAAPTPPRWDAVTAPSLVGQQLTPYWLDAELARDDIGVLYRGTRVDPFSEPGDTRSRRVLLRVAHRQVTDAAERAFMQAQCVQLAAADAAGVARVLELGFTADARPYLVSEAAYGEPIHDAARDGSLDLNSRLSLVLQAADAVSALHARQLVHGALRDTSLLVDTTRALRLVDLGATHLLDPSAAPPDGPQGDLRALGIVMYELLSGTPPWPPSVIDAPSRVPPMSHAASGVARAWERRLRGDLDAIADKALGTSGAPRYGSVTAFAADLRRYVAHEPVNARLSPLSHRLWLFVLRHGVMLLAGALLLALVAYAVERREPAAAAPVPAAVTAPPAVRTSEAAPAPVAPPVAAPQAVTPPGAAAPVPAPAAPPAAPSTAVAAERRRSTPAAPVVAGAREGRRIIAELAKLDSMSPDEQATPAARRRYATAFSRLARMQDAAGNARDALSSSRRAHAAWQAIADSDPTDLAAQRAAELEVQRIRRLQVRVP